MSIFFDADKYITRIESPRIDASKSNREQIKEYIIKYFNMFSHDYIQTVMFASKIYADEIYAETDIAGQSSEVQAITIMVQMLQDFSKNSLKDFEYQKPLAAQEAFKMYCGLMSKLIELGIVAKKLASKSIEAYYKTCEIG